jgi:RNA polymerase sigma-70 factor (ECF subfamily)
VDIGDGDLVRLARAGDPVAFRLLVERHRPMVRVRAARLCFHPDDVDDVVQESFLQAFVSLDRLRDPGRFAGWMGGIVLNVCRALQRRAPLTLLGDWPEQLHPLSGDGLPSADDIDRNDALRRAVAALPAGQRQAIDMYYYSDLPVGEIAGSAGAAKASLHKARRRLREYITTHRPDLIPASRRTHMTAVRIAHAVPRPGKLGDGIFLFNHVVVVLADDAGHRALPIWLTEPDGESLFRVLDRPAAEAGTSAGPAELTSEALTGQLLRAAGVTVTGVDLDELGPEVTAARIELTSPSGTQHVTARLGYGLALAAASGAPVRVASAMMDRLAEPVPGQDMLGPFLDRKPLPARPPLPHWRPRFEPRNLAFTDGLDSWRLGGSFLHEASGSHWEDYSSTAEDRTAVLSSAVPQPCGFAFLGQKIFADDYRGAAVVFRGELRTEDVADDAGLFLRLITKGRHAPRPVTMQDVRNIPGNHLRSVAGSHDWTRYEVTAHVPDDVQIVWFGIFLTGRGRVELRNAELTHGS